ncbi:MAG: triose-phosphate isomerase [Holosporaceae bacterium]|nr:triose-phosphate isomerase [Holosporaceae bacterium]
MKIIVANWKMNGGVDLADEFIEEINTITSPNTIVVCPPAVLISRFGNFSHRVGAQNCFCEENGAFTGENSPKLLKEAGCKYVILGHSERRSIFCEDDELIFKKWKAAVAQDLIPIVCIGEKIEDRDNWKETISRQLDFFLDDCPLGDTIFAYEPVWSIGTGLIPTEEKIETIFAFIKELLGDEAPLLYGGSVTSENAQRILACQNVDGFLVGGASLKIDEFKKIVAFGAVFNH